MKENKPNILLIVRDVSYFNQLKAMKTVNINKSKMLSQVSHEFRTPLNCITLMIQSLMLELD
jgi:signal transduction histidine kinase